MHERSTIIKKENSLWALFKSVFIQSVSLCQRVKKDINQYDSYNSNKQKNHWVSLHYIIDT